MKAGQREGQGGWSSASPLEGYVNLERGLKRRRNEVPSCRVEATPSKVQVIC